MNPCADPESSGELPKAAVLVPRRISLRSGWHRAAHAALHALFGGFAEPWVRRAPPPSCRVSCSAASELHAAPARAVGHSRRPLAAGSGRPGRSIGRVPVHRRSPAKRPGGTGWGGRRLPGESNRTARLGRRIGSVGRAGRAVRRPSAGVSTCRPTNLCLPQSVLLMCSRRYAGPHAVFSSTSGELSWALGS
eukprot:15449582-Alexandrium_andersonii.AAC.1